MTNINRDCHAIMCVLDLHALMRCELYGEFGHVYTSVYVWRMASVNQRYYICFEA